MGKRALWFISSVRHLKIFWGWVNQVTFVDKLIVHNHMHHDAHRIARNFFLKHKEYDYYIISSDDILGSPSQVRLLLKDEEKHRFLVIGGWNNRRLDDGYAAVCVEPVNKRDIKANTITAKSYPCVSIKKMLLNYYGYPFAKVWFSGLSLTLCKRSVVEKIKFRPYHKEKDMYCITPKTKKHGRGKMFDLQFAIDCEAHRIPINVDVRIFLLHCKGTKNYVRVGKAPAKVEFIKATTS